MKNRKIIGILAIGFFVLSAVSAITTSHVAAADTSLVVAIDMAHGGFHATDVKQFLGNLTSWGYTSKNLTSTFTADSLSGVDVLITFPPNVNDSFQFTAAELTVVKDWFNTGDKGVWAAGDSDFADPNGKVAAGLDKLLEAIGSQVLTEQASLESDLQAGTNAPYRVRAPTFNTNETYIVDNFLKNANNHMLFIHGPAPLLGVKDGTKVALEGNEAYFKDHNVFWVTRAVNNATYKSTIARVSADGLTYQVHGDSANGDFIVYTAERYAGDKKNSKIIVTAEAIMSDYKSMFNNQDEKLNPTDNNVLVKNSIAWFGVTETASTPGFELLGLFIAIVPLAYYYKKKRN